MSTMKFYVEKNTVVEDVKKVFRDYYPYLKIEFYKIPIFKKEKHDRNHVLC
jgi:hypothetical protein